MPTGTLEYLLPVSVGAATLSVFIAFLVIRCYLQWKRQHRKEQLMAEGAVPKLVLSSQPVDFLVPLLIQDRLEEEEEVDQFKTHSSVSGASSEDISHEAELKNQTAGEALLFVFTFKIEKLILLNNTTHFFVG